MQAALSELPTTRPIAKIALKPKTDVDAALQQAVIHL